METLPKTYEQWLEHYRQDLKNWDFPLGMLRSMLETHIAGWNYGRVHNLSRDQALAHIHALKEASAIKATERLILGLDVVPQKPLPALIGVDDETPGIPEDVGQVVQDGNQP